ncbi:MAG TPA: ankyrin repeat domain-containing protein [Thermoanaerobaculia bacterium]
MSELTDAIKAGDVARVTSLIDADANVLTERENGTTPVMIAVYHGKTDVARAIAERSPSLSFPELCALGESDRAKAMLAADPSLLNARSTDGFPALGLAIFFRHGELARWLIEQGADVNAAADNALRVAPLHAAAATCDHETTRMLLAHGADPHAKQQMDYTPLHGAASRGDVALAKILLTHGADLGAKGSDGLTAADIAAKYGHPTWLLALTA